MGRAFDQEFAEGVWRYQGTPYALAARMAAGRDGTTFLGFDRFGKAKAVKIFGPGYPHDLTVRIRMANAAAQIDALECARIAPGLEVAFGGGMLWLAGGYVPGPSLQEAVQEYGPLSRESVRCLALALAEAFTALHRAGLTGRGLEPRDVVLGREGAVVVEPGIGRVEGAGGLAQTSPEFAAPSSAVADDVRALGAVLYLAATGRPASSASGDILSPAVGNCPNALRETIEASRRQNPALRPSLADLARAASATPTASAAAAQWSAQPWESADILREIDERAQDVARLRTRAIERSVLAPVPGSGPGAQLPPVRGRETKIKWENPDTARGAGPRTKRWFAATTARVLVRRLGNRGRDADRQVYR
jgi:serine/threonine protein kinase